MLLAFLGALYTAPLPHDIAAISSRRVLRVAMLDRDDAPYYWRDSSGVLRGSDVDIARDLGRALAVRVQFDRSARTVDDVIARVAAGRDDLAISKLSVTLNRARRIVFSNPYATIHQALLLDRVAYESIARGRRLWDVLHDYRGTLGTIEDSAYGTYALRNFPGATVVRYASWDPLLSALERGTVVAAYADEPDIEAQLRLAPALTLSLRLVVLTDRQDRIAIGVASDSPALLALVNEYIAERTQR